MGGWGGGGMRQSSLMLTRLVWYSERVTARKSARFAHDKFRGILGGYLWKHASVYVI